MRIHGGAAQSVGEHDESVRMYACIVYIFACWYVGEHECVGIHVCIMYGCVYDVYVCMLACRRMHGGAASDVGVHECVRMYVCIMYGCVYDVYVCIL